MTSLSYEKAVYFAEEGVAERGEDYVYPRDNTRAPACVYLEQDGSPSCLVGYVLSKVITLPMDMNKFGGAYSAFHELFRRGLIDEFDSRAIDFLAELQGYQDRGTPWGESVRRAKEAVS